MSDLLSIRDVEFINAVKEGTRPNIKLISQKWVRELLENCWSGSPYSRPSFDEIVEAIHENNYKFTDKDPDLHEIQRYWDEIKAFEDQYPPLEPVLM
jgi:hypothetical protein